MNEEDRVRALLAEQGSAATEAQIPDEVAARLEDTLALLGAERASEHEIEGGQVVPMRRRWLPRSLVAAAAVVILGVGGASIAGLGGLGGLAGEMSTSADSAAGGEAGSGSGSDTGGATSDEGLVESAPGGDAPQLQRDLVTGQVASLSSATFARDVRRLLASPHTKGRHLLVTERLARAVGRARSRLLSQPVARRFLRHFRRRPVGRRPRVRLLVRQLRRPRSRTGRDQHAGRGGRFAGRAGGAPGRGRPPSRRGLELRGHHPGGHDHRRTVRLAP